MSNGEEPGILRRAWDFLGRIWCTLVCAWKEILVWIVVMALVAVLIYLLVVLTISFFAEVVLTAPAGPGAWVVNIVLAIVAVVVIILVLLVVALLVEYVTHQMRQKVWACWQSC